MSDSPSKPADLQVAYQSAVFGEDRPEIMWTNLGILRQMFDQLSADPSIDIRADIRKFIMLTANNADNEPVVLTTNSVGFYDLGTA